MSEHPNRDKQLDVLRQYPISERGKQAIPNADVRCSACGCAWTGDHDLRCPVTAALSDDAWNAWQEEGACNRCKAPAERIAERAPSGHPQFRCPSGHVTLGMPRAGHPALRSAEDYR